MQLRLYQKLRSSKGLVFCKPCNNVLDPRKLENVTVGSLVEINTTPSSRTANFVKGRVKKRSTEQDYCPTGIPVELEEGGKGNTERIIEFVPSKIDPDLERIKNGESETVEFKETFSFDAKRFRNTGEKAEKESLQFYIPKSIAGFGNNKGGILYLGVNDNSDVVGLENDFEVMNVNADHFEQRIKDCIKKYFSSTIVDEVSGRKTSVLNEFIFGRLSLRMLQLEGKNVYKIQVQKSRVACIVYKDCTLMEHSRAHSLPFFYVRQANTTEPLTAEQFIQYWENREHD